MRKTKETKVEQGKMTKQADESLIGITWRQIFIRACKIYFSSCSFACYSRDSSGYCSIMTPSSSFCVVIMPPSSPSVPFTEDNQE